MKGHLAFGIVVLCWPQGVVAEDLYERVEVAVRNDRAYSNPFTDTELRLTVKAPVNRALGSEFTWYGFLRRRRSRRANRQRLEIQIAV